MNGNKKALIQFNPKLPKLSKSEKAVLDLLVEAGKLIVPLYIEQEKQLQENGNFYPKGVSRKEVDEAAVKNSAILSPFTVVEKVEGRLIAIPYHVKYAKFLEPIAQKLIEGSKVSQNKEFSRFLNLQAKALTEGSYEEASAAGLRMKPYILDISIGPLDYLNRLFAGKAAYHCWVGVLDAEGTKRLNNYKSIVYNASRQPLEPNERIENPNNVKAKTINEVLVSGIAAKSRFVGLNLPMDMSWVKKYGSEVTVFNQTNNLRMEEQIMPTFTKIFTPAFRAGFTTEDLRRASLRHVALHELAHNYLYYKNAAKNLQDLFPSIYELTATLLGMRIAGSLLLKERITNKQLESMIVVFICRSFDLIEKSKTDKFMINYALGGAIFINFMLKKGAIKQKGGMAITNFTKIFLSVHELSYIMENLLASGTREDAEIFIKKFGQLNEGS